MDQKLKRNIQPFNGGNYGVWKYRIKSLLQELQVLYVIDEDTPVNFDDEWSNADNIAKNTIVEYLDDSMLHFAETTNLAKETFQKLDEIYERKSVTMQMAIRKRLQKLKLKGDENLLQHYAKFDALIKELNSAGGKIEEEDKVLMLLMSMPESYENVITAIETLSEQNMTLAFVKVRLLDHESKLQAESADTSTKVLQVNSNNFKFSNRQNVNKFKRFSKFKKNIKCHYCGKNGHIKRNCYSFLNKKKTNKNNETQHEQVVERYANKNLQIVTTNKNATAESENDNLLFMIRRQEFMCDENVKFILDSGASDHIANNIELFSNYEKLEEPIKLSTAKRGSIIEATLKGTIEVVSNLGIRTEFKNVLFCKEVPNNILAVSKLHKDGMLMTFGDQNIRIMRGNVEIANGEMVKDLYVYDFRINNIRNITMLSKRNKISLKMWHERLGHISKDKLKEMVNKKLAKDIELISGSEAKNELCEACIYAKQTRLPFNSSKDKEHIKRPLFVVHSDVCGPIKPSGIENRNYFVTFIDEYTHYATVYLLTYKSDVFYAFKDYAKKSQAHFNIKIVHLYCDNGGEYLSNEMKKYCVDEGISFHLTVPYTPQLNGVAERFNRSVTEKARAMIQGAKLSKMFWGEAVVTATYLINISPTRALRVEKTPYEMWHSRKPMLQYLRIFGSTVYVHNKNIKSKFDVRSWKGILTGYAPNGYRVWDHIDKHFVVVRDVIFDEINYETSRPKLNEDNDTETSESNKRSRLNDDQEISVQEKVVEDNRNVICHNKEGEVRRSERIKAMTNKNTLMCEVCALNVIDESPMNFSEIENRSDSDKWHKAVKEEINSLIENGTWEIVDTPRDKNIVDCKWVFTIKHDEYGKPIRYKARLVAKGFSQEYLTDYNETFAPVARMTSFRIMCAFANQYKLLIHQMDVKTAFLNGILKEDIYMKIPEGVVGGGDKVCKLKKALYGLKQAARCWFEMFEQTLIEKGFETLPTDRCVYVLNKGSIIKNIFVILYVDDIVIVTANLDVMKSFKEFLKRKFKMEDMNEIKYFLGIQIERYENKICLNQMAYIKRVLGKFNMIDCNPVSTPLPTKLNYQALNENESCSYPCRSLIGCMMYIMLCTRPDISAAVGILSRYSNKENKELWQGLKRILRYLKGTLNLKLMYERKEYENVICGYVDSDWGSDDVDRKSTSGYLFKMYDNCSISWITRKQTSVAASSTEAEYMALFEATREAKWLKMFIESIHRKIEKPILIYEDNNGCICIASNPSSHKRSKHIDIKYHFIKEQVEMKSIKLKYIPTGNQIADAMTKSLPEMKFVVHRSEMGLF